MFGVAVQCLHAHTTWWRDEPQPVSSSVIAVWGQENEVGALWPNSELVRGSLVQALRPYLEGVHRLFNLPLVGLVKYRAEDLLDPHGHLPAYPLLLVGGPIYPRRWAVVSMPPGRVPQHVSYCVKALLAQHFYETEDSCLLDLFQGLEVS
jgi:hypothetical protein